MQAGVPMIIFIVGGSVGLSAFMQTHYELKDKKLNTQTVRNYDLAAEHAAMMKKLDVENFTLSRIPRPEELVAASALRNEKKKEKEARWAPKTVYTVHNHLLCISCYHLFFWHFLHFLHSLHLMMLRPFLSSLFRSFLSLFFLFRRSLGETQGGNITCR